MDLVNKVHEGSEGGCRNRMRNELVLELGQSKVDSTGYCTMQSQGRINVELELISA